MSEQIAFKPEIALAKSVLVFDCCLFMAFLKKKTHISLLCLPFSILRCLVIHLLPTQNSDFSAEHAKEFTRGFSSAAFIQRSKCEYTNYQSCKDTELRNQTYWLPMNLHLTRMSSKEAHSLIVF